MTQGLSRALNEQLVFSKTNVTSLDWVTYPILRFKDAPKITFSLVQRTDIPAVATRHHSERRTARDGLGRAADGSDRCGGRKRRLRRNRRPRPGSADQLGPCQGSPQGRRHRLNQAPQQHTQGESEGGPKRAPFVIPSWESWAT